MPRGSDADAAGEELKARTGFAPNAEDAIAENTARFTEELRAASNRPIDQEATDEMDEDEAQGYLEDDDQTVVNYAVRGPFVVIVAEDEEGALTKSVYPLKGKEKQAERAAKRGASKKDEDDGDDNGDEDDTKSAPARRSTAASGASSGAASK